MNRSSRILLSTALLVFVVGAVLAVTKPGSLGDEDTETAAPSATTTSTTSESISPDGDGATPTSVDPAAGGPADTTPTTAGAGDTPTTPTTVATSPTTQAGSGLGSSGTAQPSDTADGLAATGGESLMLAGLALGAIGLVSRRRTPHLS